MARAQTGTGLGIEARLPAARAFRGLFSAGLCVEVGGRSAYVVYVPLEVRHLGYDTSFAQYVLIAACLDDSALVRRYRAEGAFSEAAPMGGDAEANFPQRGNFIRAVRRMSGARVRQSINGVKLLRIKRRRRRVVYRKPRSLILNQPAPVREILLLAEQAESLRKSFTAARRLFV